MHLAFHGIDIHAMVCNPQVKFLGGQHTFLRTVRGMEVPCNFRARFRQRLALTVPEQLSEIDLDMSSFQKGPASDVS
jgi:hypothetical protein